MNMEYEYSFKVTDLKPFIGFIIENNFIQIEENIQTRTLYKRDDKTMARITEKGKEKNKKVYLDFKDDEDSEQLLKERRETLPLKIDDMDSVLSILQFLNYKKDKVLIRKRTVYQKDSVVFEIDDYESPEKMYVVAVEGDKESVDRIYLQVKNRLQKYFKNKNN